MSDSKPKKNRPLAPSGGNDKIYTPTDLSKVIIDHFMPSGRILDPCRGDGSFSNLMTGCDWCEIDDGVDFFKTFGKWDWIVTNPPWSQFRNFLKHGMEVADNIVFLSLINAWFMKARQNDMREAGFGIVEILTLPVPPSPWPQTGFSLGATWARRGWTGGISVSKPKNKS